MLWLLGWLGIILILSCCCFPLAYFDFIVNSGFSSILRCLVDINCWLWGGLLLHGMLGGLGFLLAVLGTLALQGLFFVGLLGLDRLGL